MMRKDQKTIRVIQPLLIVIGNAEQIKRCPAFWVAFVMPFHRHDLHRLMFERVQPVLMAGRNLQWRHQKRHPHRHREHAPRLIVAAIPQQVQSTATGAIHPQRRPPVQSSRKLPAPYGQGGTGKTG